MGVGDGVRTATDEPTTSSPSPPSLRTTQARRHAPSVGEGLGEVGGRVKVLVPVGLALVWGQGLVDFLKVGERVGGDGRLVEGGVERHDADAEGLQLHADAGGEGLAKVFLGVRVVW